MGRRGEDGSGWWPLVWRCEAAWSILETTGHPVRLESRVRQGVTVSGNPEEVDKGQTTGSLTSWHVKDGGLHS